MSEPTMPWILQSDISSIIEIENQCFPFPWDERDFDICLKNKDNVGLVIEKDHNIIGYLIFSLGKNCYNVISLAVDPKMCRKGYGNRMIQYLITKIRSSTQGPRNKINVIVSDQNLNCHQFLKAISFTAIKVRKNYFGPLHDAYEFVLDMNEVKKNIVKRNYKAKKNA